MASIYGLRSVLFDLWHRVQTTGAEQIDGLNIRGQNGSQATWYEPADAKVLSSAFSSLGIVYSQYVVVDVGSGKGRAVLIASSYPFKKVVGVEFAKELHDAAVKNRSSWRGKRKCELIEFVWCDVLEFEIPSEPCVVLLFNPFGEDMLRRFLQKLQRSVDYFPREINIVYVNPKHEGPFLFLPNVALISRSPYYAIYRITPPPPVPPSGELASRIL